MARTLSIMPELGSKAPYFSLQDTISGKLIHFNEQSQHKATLVMFICNHCPFVKMINAALSKLGMDYLQKDMAIYAINSNDVEAYPDDAPNKMKQIAEENHYTFPYLFDDTQEVAHAYQAACTPDFFLYNQAHELVYRGQFDDSRPGNDIVADGRSLRAAIDALLGDKAVSVNQQPSIGCNIKWRITQTD